MVMRSPLIAAIEADFLVRLPGYHKSRREGLSTLTGLMLALPVHLQRGQCYLPVTMMQQRGFSHEALMNRRDEDKLRLVLADLCALAQSHLDKSLTAQKSLPVIQRGAFLPLSLVPLHLKAVLKNQHPALQISSVAQCRKQWTLWRGARRIA